MSQNDSHLLIQNIGIPEALEKLLPFVRTAGQLAKTLQPAIARSETKTEKGGSSFASALTDADLLIEDRLGSDILTLFADASFYGEERKQDRISRWIPDDRPFIVTLDPVNCTLCYRDGLPLYETIVTICDRKWKMLGAIIYRPSYDRVYLAHHWDGERDTVSYWWSGQEKYTEVPLHLPHTSSIVVYLDGCFSDKEEVVRRAGYIPIFPWRDYDGQSDWLHTSCNLLTGHCRGILNRRAQLIDAAAFGFIAACAGGVWKAGRLDRNTLKYEYGLAASDKETADLLTNLL